MILKFLRRILSHPAPELLREIEEGPLGDAERLEKREDHTHQGTGHTPGLRWGMVVLALGVVYGDIGTSPLYALRDCFIGEHRVPPTPENILGLLSLVFWTLIMLVTVKYQLYVLRADNRGEGGIFALMALVRPHITGRRGRAIVVTLGLFGAALLYGDGIVTPAISILSAVEGLEVTTSVFHPYLVPITIGILIAFFKIQRRGSGGIGKICGPIMIVWFATLTVLGFKGIVTAPVVLTAINPLHAIRFFANNGFHGFLILGTVFLVATGGEALYADMGHFGQSPIRVGWFTMVLPALVLNYFGQGALLLTNPEAVKNPFYLLAPEWALYPLVALATLATIIASQACVSGAFSLTRQAIQLDYLPKMQVIHTSPTEVGQVYLPAINWLLMGGTISLVLYFQTSTALAAAYGAAVVTTMLITTVLAGVAAFKIWHWPGWVVLLVSTVFGVIDLAFFAANVEKIPGGGYVPVALAIAIQIVMTTWKRGRELVAKRLQEESFPVTQFVESMQGSHQLARVAGTAVFMTRDPQAIAPSMLHNAKLNKVLHEQVILLTVFPQEIPEVAPENCIEITNLGPGFSRVVANFGFMQIPSVPDILDYLREKGLELDLMRTSFFLSRETLLPGNRPDSMALWREKLFAVMSRNAVRPTDFFRIPANRVVELGVQVKL